MASPKVSRYCPICGKYIDVKVGMYRYLDYIVSGSGEYRKKRYYHTECLEQEIGRFYRKSDL